MGSEEEYIELRVAYPGHPYVAVLGKRSSAFAFERIFNCFYKGRERLPDGRQEQIHHLPDATLTYEIQEVREGKRLTWYAATVEGDSNIYRISRHGALLVARNAMSIRDVIRDCPEMPQIDVEEE